MARNGGVGYRRLKFDDRFAWLGKAHRFASESFDALGVIMKGIHRELVLARFLLLFFDLGVQLQNVFAHTFVLSDERQVPDPDREQPGDEKQEHDEASQL